MFYTSDWHELDTEQGNLDLLREIANFLLEAMATELSLGANCQDDSPDQSDVLKSSTKDSDDNSEPTHTKRKRAEPAPSRNRRGARGSRGGGSVASTGSRHKTNEAGDAVDASPQAELQSPLVLNTVSSDDWHRKDVARLLELRYEVRISIPKVCTLLS